MRSIINASSPNGRRLCGRPASRIGVEDVHGVVGLDRDLEAEVPGVARPGQRHLRRPDLRLCVPEERQGVGLGRERGQHGARSWSLDGEDAVVLGDVLELDAEPPDAGR